jgi:ribonuclease Z
MRVTLLGTGTPVPSADRFGSAILVEAGSELLMFDCGRGATIRLYQVQTGYPSRLLTVFLTHLHSDHIVGLPDLWLTGWVLGRQQPLHILGPEGTTDLTVHLARAYGADVKVRQGKAEALPPRGAELHGHVVRPGVVYEENDIRVIAFLVDHGHVDPAFGYRVEYAGRSVVISGDTKFSESLIAASSRADVVLHTAWLPEATNTQPAELRSIATAEEAGQVFARLNPKLAVVYHYLAETGLEAAVRRYYDGPLVVGRDRMVIEVDDHTPGSDLVFLHVCLLLR